MKIYIETDVDGKVFAQLSELNATELENILQFIKTTFLDKEIDIVQSDSLPT